MVSLYGQSLPIEKEFKAMIGKTWVSGYVFTVPNVSITFESYPICWIIVVIIVACTYDSVGQVLQFFSMNAVLN
jgi:hypothetical protein